MYLHFLSQICRGEDRQMAGGGEVHREVTGGKDELTEERMRRPDGIGSTCRHVSLVK